MLEAEQLSSPGESGLDLVADEEDIVLLAESLAALKVVVVGNDDTGIDVVSSSRTERR